MNKKLICQIIRIIIVVSTLAAVISVCGRQTDSSELGPFVYFTTDSNIFMAFIALISIFVDMNKNKAFKMIKLMATCAVTLTFLTVVFFLAPRMGYIDSFKGAYFPMHLSTPLLAAVMYIFFEENQKLRTLDFLFGLVPTIIYGAIYTVEVVVIGQENGGWNDFYMFLAGGASVSGAILAMLAATSVISFLLVKGNSLRKTN